MIGSERMTVATPTIEIPASTSRSASGRLRQDGLGDSDRNYSIFMHLSPMVMTIIGASPAGLLVPLVLWLVRRNQSAFNDDHGREVINFSLSFLLWHVICAITVIGLIFWPVLWIVAIVNNIRGALAASRSEYFRYPMTLRFLS